MLAEAFTVLSVYSGQNGVFVCECASRGGVRWGVGVGGV